MRHHAISILLCATAFAGCRTSSSSGTLAGPEGPVHTRPGWIKSPEAIEGTITQAWGINIDSKDRTRYLQSMYSLLGGTLVLNTRSLVDQPNELFVIGLDNLSDWLADKLLEKQKELAGKDYVFEGLGFSTDDAASCFDDDAKDWCDFRDGVKVTSLSDQGIDPASLPKSWKKRLMHNVQDIGEFMLLAVDNTLKMPGGERHAAEYLIDEVFLKTYASGPKTAEGERAAWREVIYTILMSGGFYLEAPVDVNASAH